MYLVLKCFLNDYVWKDFLSSLLDLSLIHVCFPSAVGRVGSNPLPGCALALSCYYAWAKDVMAAGEAADGLDVRTFIPSQTKKQRTPRAECSRRMT